ncbi:MAG: DNA-binding response regulator [Hahellaceae bacterium]|nr:DNA-binding response regulator [Hahellaceae bacterium]MCP5211240.1 DNA-binding response regulator [Hahellaceae bacterium]
MSRQQKIFILEKDLPSALSGKLESLFTLVPIRSITDVESVEDITSCKVLVIGPSIGISVRRQFVEQMKKSSNSTVEGIPIVLVANEDELSSKLDAFQSGCDDYITPNVPFDELVMRLNKAIFNKIANDQLQSQVKMANEAAFSAMADTSKLGVNVHFLLDSFNCSNLDELGQQLFQALNHYGLKCSLQMRGRYEIKNMEQNGMAKDLEAQLLSELKDAGRYYDFGKRSVMNYEQVSLLVKNMPVDDERQYGAIKDNVFSLLQGTDARIKAIDDRATLNKERALLEGLTKRLQSIFVDLDDSYQDLMKSIADNVESMAEKIENSVMSLGLTENQEKILEAILTEGVRETNEVFSKGIKVDEELRNLIERISVIFEFKDRPDFYRYLDKIKTLVL